MRGSDRARRSDLGQRAHKGRVERADRHRRLFLESLEPRRVLASDFGDAPTPFPTLVADNGAVHESTGPTLGEQRDTENDGQPTTAADGDDAGGADDEDGVTFGRVMAGQLDVPLIVNVQNAPGGARLDGWIDFNADGSWGGPGEQVFDNLAVAEGDNTLAIDIPSWSAAGQTYARFRLSSGR